MKLPVLKSHEVIGSTPPILIVDKIGVIGEALAKDLSQDFLIVLISPRSLHGKNEKIIHVPFKKKIPEVPDNRYSKIFIIDDGQSITRKSSFSFIAKARENNCAFYFIGSIRNTDVKHANEIATSFSKSQVLIFGDLFDKNIFFDRNSSISRFILQARKTGKIQILGDGLGLNFPISFEDTIKLIIKASFLEISQKTILLFARNPITDISLANTFRKINPDIQVDFIKEKNKNEIFIPNNSMYALSKYNLLEKIKDLRLEDKENREVKIVSKKDKRKNFFRPVLAFFVLLLFVILLPFLTTSSYIVLGEREIGRARRSAEIGDFDKARKQLKNSNTFFDIAMKTSVSLVLEGKYLGMRANAEKIKNKAYAGQMISLSGISLLDGGERLKNIYNDESMDPKGDFMSASNSFKNSISLIQRAKAEGVLPKNIQEGMDSAVPFIDLFSNSTEILPEVLGFDSPKKYLVIFQDNSELRPGGGVVESFAIVKIKNAKIIEFNTFSESPIDENLKTQIDPAFGLRRYLPLQNLTLRDSSFDPDFINSAIAASSIYSLVADEKVDGVVAIDADFIRNLLQVTGPIAIAKDNEELSVDNLENFISNENNLEIDSLELIKNYLENSKKVSYLPLVREIGTSIKEKHLLFAFPKVSDQNIFTVNGWSSSLWDNREKENNKINDYLGISEANLGKNKINKFISRSVSKKIFVSGNGKISSEINISYKNNSSDIELYKNYIQLILPEASKLSSVAVDGKSVKLERAIINPQIYNSIGFKPPFGLEIDERNEMDKNIYSFLIQIPASEIRTITINYDLPYSLPSTQKSATYSLKIYKQPGIDFYPFDLSFDLLENQRVLGLDQNFSKEIRNDEDFQFTIAQR